MQAFKDFMRLCVQREYTNGMDRGYELMLPIVSIVRPQIYLVPGGK